MKAESPRTQQVISGLDTPEKLSVLIKKIGTQVDRTKCFLQRERHFSYFKENNIEEDIADSITRFYHKQTKSQQLSRFK